MKGCFSAFQVDTIKTVSVNMNHKLIDSIAQIKMCVCVCQRERERERACYEAANYSVFCFPFSSILANSSSHKLTVQNNRNNHRQKFLYNKLSEYHKVQIPVRFWSFM